MASGYTTTTAVADSLPQWIMAARQVREYAGVVPQLVDRQTLGEGIGETWHEVSFAQLSAQAITETTTLTNYQQVSDTDLSIEPTVIGIAVLITDKVAKRIAKVAYSKIGSLAQNAIERKKDEDGIATFDGATTALCGAGKTLTTGEIFAGTSRIRGNATEPGPDPLRCVLHPYQIKDLQDELVATGTYPIPEGPSAQVFKNGYKLVLDNTEVYPDGNIPINSSTDDAKGGLFSQMGIIIVQGRAPKAYSEFHPEIGGGATIVYHYDEYAYGERSAGNWLYEIYSDAALPTS